MNNNLLKISATSLLITMFFSSCNSCDKKKHKKVQDDINQPQQSVFDLYLVNSQYFTFLPNIQTEIIGDQGTVLRFEKGCFLDKNGKVITDSIVLELKECYTPSDIIFTELSTVSTKGLLETGGMIYINAISNGESLMINPNKPYELGFPLKGKRKKGMKLFKGMDNQGELIWGDVLAEEKKDSIFVEGGYVDKISYDLDNYFYSSIQLGWLNCDRLITNELEELVVNVGKNINPNIRVIFTNIKAIGHDFERKNDKEFLVRNLPKNEEAYVLCFYTVNGKTNMYLEKIFINEKKIITPVFKEVTAKELKIAIDKIVWDDKI